MRNNPSPILVTGAHRSGTTWVGKMLATGGETAYISEPLNIHHRPGVLDVPTKYWYTYICEQNQSEYLDAFEDTLNFRYHIWEEIKAVRTVKDALRMFRDWSTFLRGKLFNKRPMLKDPFAIFSAPWFQNSFNCQIVIVIRHPAAFVSSLLRLGWSFELDHLLAQPLLLDNVLQPYREELTALEMKSDDIVGRGCLLWNLIYQVVDGFRQEDIQFQLVRHEDLSHNPIEGYSKLFNYLGLHISEKAARAISRSTSAENPKEISTRKKHSTNLNSVANLENWKHRLTKEEITSIHELTYETASLFYPDSIWE